MDYYKLKVLNHKRKIITTLTILLIIGGVLFYYFNYYQNSEEKEILKDDIKTSSDTQNFHQETIWVDIKGYVSSPGVYSFDVDENARVNDLILKAGGLKKDADTSILNLSKKLEDEMSVIIYSKSEIQDYLKMQDKLKKELEMCEIKLKNDACLSVNNEVTNNLININKATKEELMTLKGLGEAKALAIIKYRENNTFQSIDELKNVEGIGENLFESIKDNITI